jgi:hypothetical protein
MSFFDVFAHLFPKLLTVIANKVAVEWIIGISSLKWWVANHADKNDCRSKKVDTLSIIWSFSKQLWSHV